MSNVILFLKGFAMGIAEIIPGISGGTIAFLLGIYEDFILAIRSFDAKFFGFLLTGRLKEAFNHCHWKYLAVLVSGMLLAIFSLAHVLSWALDNHPVIVHSFFFGLILATGPIIAKIIERWSWGIWATLIIFTVGTYFFVELIPIKTPDSSLFLFFCGAIAISAMILPGISGSFVLLLLGKYTTVLGMVKSYDIIGLLIFVAGIVAGVMSFVRVLGWLFKRYHDLTLAALTGFVLGSLNKIWPWKNTLSWMKDPHGMNVPARQVNTLPDQIDIYVITALIAMAGGFIIAMLLNQSPKKALFKAEE